MFKLLLSLFSIALLLTSPAPRPYTDQFREPMADSLPPLPPPPPMNNGWMGTYSYVVKLEGSGNQPKPYSYYVKFHRVHTGYVVLERLVKGAIRVNQPDKYNEQRWESWINVGSKKSFNMVNDSLHEVTVITSDPCCRTPHDHYRTMRAGSSTAWQEGFSSSPDLQIDHQTGTFIFSMPTPSIEVEYRDIWRIAKDVKASNNYVRDVDENGKTEFKTYASFNDMDTLMGQFSKGQREIQLRRTGTITYTDLLWEEPGGKKITIQPASKGTVEFRLTLKRIGG